MTPLMVKGVLFGLLLLSAAVWDMRNREIPNLIPALLLLCGLIGFRPAASVAGLFLVGGPFLLAAVLIKRDGFAIGGGDMKLMGACGFVLGVWPGLIQAVLSLWRCLSGWWNAVCKNNRCLWCVCPWPPFSASAAYPPTG